MALLLESDYEELDKRGIEYVEDEQNRFLILLTQPLPEGVYNEKDCNILVIIPQNYNHSGNDMFWTFPHLTRTNGKSIPRMNNPGGGDNRRYNGDEYCRWSRHWNNGKSVWRPGKDDIVTILHRLTYALNTPGD